MKKIFSALLVIFFIHAQASARAGTFDFNSSFNKLAHDVSNGKLNSNELIEQSKQVVKSAQESGLNEEELLEKLSEKMSLGLTQDEIRDSVEDLKTNPSQEKLQDIADKLTQNKSGDKFIQVLVTFALLSLLLFGIFFMLASPYPR